MKKRPIIIVTGTSGSGKSTALAAFEDAGFYCIDNMPVRLLPHFLQQSDLDQKNGPIAGWVFGMDLRDRNFLPHCRAMIDDLKQHGHPVTLVFLEAEEQILLRRYNQTRRHHPLGHCGSLHDAIREEKKQMQPLRKEADHVIDTSRFSVHELKFAILNIARQHTAISGMAINVVSFGFKYGAIPEADLVMDVRFLSNPYFRAELKDLDGESKEIQDFVLQDPETGLFLGAYFKLLDQVIPLYEKEGKAYLTIAIGCTGGRHRSVVIAQKVYEHIKRTQPTVRLIHRDIRSG
ncbi:MAG: RNase adapter RapZ [Desulfobacteraceae bacterium]|nr:MAG: RNase adapter RapZ [Desulfobacteraceae bacterium]